MNRFASISYHKQTISNKLEDYCVRGKLEMRREAKQNQEGQPPGRHQADSQTDFF